MQKLRELFCKTFKHRYDNIEIEGYVTYGKRCKCCGLMLYPYFSYGPFGRVDIIYKNVDKDSTEQATVIVYDD